MKVKAQNNVKALGQCFCGPSLAQRRGKTDKADAGSGSEPCAGSDWAVAGGCGQTAVAESAEDFGAAELQVAGVFCGTPHRVYDGLELRCGYRDSKQATLLASGTGVGQSSVIHSTPSQHDRAGKPGKPPVSRLAYSPVGVRSERVCWSSVTQAYDGVSDGL